MPYIIPWIQSPALLNSPGTEKGTDEEKGKGKRMRRRRGVREERIEDKYPFSLTLEKF